MMTDLPKNLTNKIRRLRRRLYRDWQCTPDTQIGRLIDSYVSNETSLLKWEHDEAEGRKPAVIVRQRFVKIADILLKSMRGFEKPPVKNVEEITAEKEAALARAKAKESGDDLNPHSDQFDISKTIKHHQQVDFDFICGCEKGGFGEAGKRWARNVRKAHQLIRRINRSISENKPGRQAQAVRELREKKGMPGPEKFEVEKDEAPDWLRDSLPDFEGMNSPGPHRAK